VELCSLFQICRHRTKYAAVFHLVHRDVH
jgi:hypothetical protein